MRKQIKGYLGFMLFGFPLAIVGYALFYFKLGYEFGYEKAEEHMDQAVDEYMRERGDDA